MKVIYTHGFPFGKYSYINIFGIIFGNIDNLKYNTISNKTYNHEKIHLKQMQETLWIGFYIWYAIEYIIIRLFHKKQNNAYHDVSFEEEAYNNENDINYISNRKHYNWIKYIKVKSNK